MIEKIISSMPLNSPKAVSKICHKAAFSEVPQGQQLLLKGQEMLANSKLGTILAQNNAGKFTPVAFSPAKTLEEATDFAKKNLGIFDFQIKDLEVANHINEAVCAYKNKAQRKAPVFHGVFLETTNKNRNFEMAAHNDGMFSRLIIPYDYAKADFSYLFDPDLVDFYKTLLEAKIDLTQSQSAMLKKAISDPSAFNRFDNLALENFVARACALAKDQVKKYSCIIGSGKAKEHYGTLNRVLPTVEEFSKLSERKQQELISALEKDGFLPALIDVSKFKTVFHEIGHIEHLKRVGKKYYDLVTPGSAPSKSKEFKRMFARNEAHHGELSYISDYAQVTPGEFIAETFAAILDGNKIGNDIMQVYRKYAGPLV